MRGARCSFVVFLVTATTASAAPMLVEGEVTDARSRWTSDGSRIVTDATVRTPTGDVVVSQLGGSVDGLAMRTWPGPDLLVPGMRVAVSAHQADDLSARTHVVVDAVRILATPPGYVRSGPTKAGAPLYWESSCIFVHAAADGTKQLPGDTELEVIEDAIATWNTAAASCSYMDLRYAGTIDKEVGRDGINLIKFRDASWCRPAVGDDPPRCHPPSAAGLATAVYVDDADSDRDGALVDVDIELNGEEFAISDKGVTLGAAGCKAELANTLTHELGHMIGIEHPCLAAGDPPRIDDEGKPVALCSSVMNNPTITESTMYNFQDCDETKKTSLEAEDIAAICGIYPRAEDPGSCEPVDLTPGGCCSATNRPVPALLLGSSVVLLLGRRRRR